MEQKNSTGSTRRSQHRDQLPNTADSVTFKDLVEYVLSPGKHQAMTSLIEQLIKEDEYFEHTVMGMTVYLNEKKIRNYAEFEKAYVQTKENIRIATSNILCLSESLNEDEEAFDTHLNFISDKSQEEALKKGNVFG